MLGVARWAAATLVFALLFLFVGGPFDQTEDYATPLILAGTELPEQALVAEALSLKAGRKVEILVPQRGEKRAVVQHAETNAREALERRLAETAGQAKLLEGVAQLFNLPGTPERIEVYDNSHIMGTNPYGVMIVAGAEGFMKNAYRKFGIRGPITPGDDFAMMREMLQRRFSRALKEQAEGAPTAEWPDLLLIDGGAGQLSAARDVLADLGVQDVKVVAIAKGPDRDAGREWLHQEGQEAFQLPPRDPVLYFLQRLRDEAHRFAITTHRAGHPGQRTGRDRGYRTGPQTRVAQSFRIGARREDGGTDGPGGHAGDQPRDGAARLCTFPSRRADGKRGVSGLYPRHPGATDFPAVALRRIMPPTALQRHRGTREAPVRRHCRGLTRGGSHSGWNPER